ncbi:MAG: hypothetical protein JWO81_2243 [Alphaproteobacteria bacterium]|nr:hypothetical protein [Alphaproteobacteria bacterium]
MKIALITDNLHVQRWQAEALKRLSGVERVFVYDCRTPAPSKWRARHLLYYALNLFTIRNPLTRSVPVAASLEIPFDLFSFEAGLDRMWQTLPPILLDRIASDRPDVILKFGMNLLRIPDGLPTPILSYHHGDPDHYRGRPAGFYELLHGQKTMGQIVQILTNALDAGQVVASAESKLHPHSYRSSLMEAYRTSAFILERAIRNAVASVTLPRPCQGRNYRLPGNVTVLRFAAQRAAAFAKRLAYGAFFEKRWQVSTAEIADRASLVEAAILPPPGDWTDVRWPSAYSFVADPFYGPAGELVVEALHARSRRGEIVRLPGGDVLLDPSRHYSYPGFFEEDGIHYLVPEMAEVGPQRVYRMDNGRVVDTGFDLRLPRSPRLVDPTLHRSGGHVWLFANDLNEGAAPLRLWHAASLFGEFREHPDSPIRVSPLGARMAGSIFEADGVAYRPGQDFTGDYGDGLVFFRIEALMPETYRESQAAILRFKDRKGPHTMSFHGCEAAFDWYVDSFSPLAGFRRLRQSHV